MENEDANLGAQANAGALSIYGQTDAAMDDFPVLKAFQQYIDAEQSKSRKRMILLCMFFGALMTVLVAVFVFMLAQASRDKQHVNDQLIEFLMKERDRQPVPAAPTVVQPQSNPAQDAALKAMTETLSALQKQMADQKKASDEAAAAAPTKAELERQRRAEEDAEKLRKAKERLEAEKRAIADEKERLRQAEIERQRRRLYPEYYQKREQGTQPSTPQPQVESPSRESQTPSPKPVVRKRVPVLSDKDIDDILREVDDMKAADEEKARQAKKDKEKKIAEKKKAEKKKAAEKEKDQPIEYFSDSEYALPVPVDGEHENWSIPLPADSSR